MSEVEQLPAVPGRGEIRPLTSLRGLAALAVVMQHFSTTVQEHTVTTIPSIPPHGYMAVDLFFVLSGFIMAYNYQDDFRRHGLSAFPGFLGKRVARIVPLNLFMLAVIVALGQASLAIQGRNIIYTSRSFWIDLTSNVLMLQGLGIGMNMNGPSWSISVEFAAYLLFPILLIAVGFSRFRVALANTFVCIVALSLLAVTQPRLGLGAETVVANVVRCFTEFSIGLFTFRLFGVASIRAAMGHEAIRVTAMCLSVASLGLRLDLVAALSFPLLILSLAATHERASRAMSHPILRWLGVISFSLYLIHQPFREIELEILQKLHPAPLDPAWAMLLIVKGSVSVIPFAWASYTYVEHPGRRLISGLIRRGNRSDAAASKG